MTAHQGRARRPAPAPALGESPAHYVQRTHAMEPTVRELLAAVQVRLGEVDAGRVDTYSRPGLALPVTCLLLTCKLTTTEVTMTGAIVAVPCCALASPQHGTATMAFAISSSVSSSARIPSRADPTRTLPELPSGP